MIKKNDNNNNSKITTDDNTNKNMYCTKVKIKMGTQIIGIRTTRI